MSNQFLGQIILGGWNFPPRGTAVCNGSIQSIAQNTALFALIGTIYGGDGQTTFNLPNLSSRASVGIGQGAGLSNITIGQQGGAENTTLTSVNLPAHNHTATFSGSSSTLSASTVRATTQTAAAGSVLARAADTAAGFVPLIYAPSGSAPSNALGGLNVAGTVTVNPAGSGLPFANREPYLGLIHVIAIEGIFPSRN